MWPRISARSTGSALASLQIGKRQLGLPHLFTPLDYLEIGKQFTSKRCRERATGIIHLGSMLLDLGAHGAPCTEPCTPTRPASAAIMAGTATFQSIAATIEESTPTSCSKLAPIGCQNSVK
jgi:hypothetical protein